MVDCQYICETKDSKFRDFCSYILPVLIDHKSLLRDLNSIKKWDTKVLYIQTGTLYQECMQQLIDICQFILKNYSLNIRILTDSILVFDLAQLLRKYSAKIIYGLEMKQDRNDLLITLQQLQSNNFRNYCFLQSSPAIVSSMLNKIDITKCEKIWIDARNSVSLFRELITNSDMLAKLRFYFREHKISSDEDNFLKIYSENIIYV